MSHKLKTLGCVLVTAFAMSALGVAAAQAGEFEVEGNKKVTITGEQINGLITGVEESKHDFGTEVGTFRCSSSDFHGVLQSSSTELTVTATYGNTSTGMGCTVAGIAGPVVHMRSCDYLFTAGNTIGATNNIQVRAHIKCGIGDSIEITVSPTCTITIPPQSFAESMVTAENSGGAGSSMDIKMTTDLTGVNYVVHGSLCPNGIQGNTATTTNGVIKGVTTYRATDFTTGAAVGLTVK